MIDTTLVVLCAGESSRFDSTTKKQWLRIDDEPLWLNVTNKLSTYSQFSKIIVVGHKDELNFMKNYSDNFTFVAGGSTRQNSMKNALQKVKGKFIQVAMFEGQTRGLKPIFNTDDFAIFDNHQVL